MTPERANAIGERVRLFGALAFAVYRLVREAGGIAAALARMNTPPGAKAMSPFEMIAALTPTQIRGYIGQAEQFMGPLQGVRSIIEHHGKDKDENAAVGAAFVKLVLPLVVPALGPFAPFAAFLVSFVIKNGEPVQPKDPAYQLPQGNDSVNTGA